MNDDQRKKSSTKVTTSSTSLAVPKSSLKLIKVSTKTGDKGESGLISGERLGKQHLRFQAIGDVDELNSWLGLIVAKFASEFAIHKEFLLEVQDTLFYLGAELAKSPKVKLQTDQVDELESRSNHLQVELAEGWHNQFLLPGGTELGGHLDIARTVCRRAERSVVALTQKEEIRPVVFQYLNRLSDYLYILRCFINHALEYQEKKFEVEG